jgi:hypothetical protein
LYSRESSAEECDQVEMVGSMPLVGREGLEAQLEITLGCGEILSGGYVIINSDGKMVPSSTSAPSKPGLEENGGLLGHTS